MTANGTSDVGEPTRILLVEDHDDTREMMAMALRAAGYAVVAASGCADAVAKARACEFAVLVSDLQLGDGSGWELLQRLREHGPFAAIAVSGHAHPSDCERSRAAGYSEHLAKPIRIRELLEVIARCREQFNAA